MSFEYNSVQETSSTCPDCGQNLYFVIGTCHHTCMNKLCLNYNRYLKCDASLANKMSAEFIKDVESRMHDSGKRESMDTGSVRDTQEGKSRPDLICPLAIERLGHWLAMGAKKYAPHNWSKGQPMTRVEASMHRHMVKYMQGDKSEDHLVAVFCNAMFLLSFEEMIKSGKMTAEFIKSVENRPACRRIVNEGYGEPT